MNCFPVVLQKAGPGVVRYGNCGMFRSLACDSLKLRMRPWWLDVAHLRTEQQSPSTTTTSLLSPTLLSSSPETHGLASHHLRTRLHAFPSIYILRPLL